MASPGREPGTPVRGTVVSILHPGGPLAEWRALVREEGESLPVYVRSRIAPPDVGVGDDVVLRGTRSGTATTASSGEFVVDSSDAAARVDAVFRTARTLAVSSSAPEVDGTVSEHGLAFVRSSLASTRTAPGIVALVRSRGEIEPDIAWVRDRFRDLDVLSNRGAVAIFQPSSLLPGDGAAVGPAWKRWSTLFRRRISSQEDDLADVLPSAGFPGGSDAATAMALRISPSAQFMGNERNSQAGTFVVPYDPFQDGLNDWRALARARQGFMPRALAAHAARNRMTAAHEIGHAHGLDHGLFGNDNLTGSEAFADAVAMLAYVTDTGDGRSAMLWAGARAMAALNGDEYLTGAACVDAIAAARDLAARHGTGKVPMEEILASAERIARRNAVADYASMGAALDALETRSPGWRDLPPAKMRRTIEETADALPPDAAEREKVVRLMRLGAAAIATQCFTPHELRDAATRKRAADVAESSLRETCDRLRAIGMGSGVSLTLARAGRAAEVRAHPAAARRTSRVMRVFERFRLVPDPRDEFASRGAVKIHDAVRRAVHGTLLAADRIGAAFGRVPAAEAVERDLRKDMAGSIASARAVGPGRRTIKREAIVTLPSSPGASNAFDLPVEERLVRLAKLSLREIDLALEANAEPGGPTDGQLTALNRLRKQGHALAMSLVVDERDASLARLLRGTGDTGHLYLVDMAAEWRPLNLSSFPMERERLERQAEAIRDAWRGIASNPVYFDLVRHHIWIHDPSHLEARRIEWRGRDLRGIPLAGADLRGAIMSGCDLSGLKLPGTSFDGASIEHCAFRGATMTGASLKDARLHRCDFRGATDLDLDAALRSPEPDRRPRADANRATSRIPAAAEHALETGGMRVR